ncbi:MAG TPA: enolase C-terminal domain-like protein [Thermomicrobiales bacterium]|nr:enolase C-terminal domain-like protein [Thermomicrobiales bacterium]
MGHRWQSGRHAALPDAGRRGARAGPALRQHQSRHDGAPARGVRAQRRGSGQRRFSAVKLAPFDGMDRLRIHEREQRQRVQHGLDCVAAVREAVGSHVDVLVDCHEHFDLPTAVAVGKALYALGITWFEESLPVGDVESLARLRSSLPELQMIGGERLYDIAGFWPYLAAGVWDVVMPDVKHCGGIHTLAGIAQAAGARGVSTAPHNPSGPVAMAASAHVAATLPQLHSLEYAWGEVPWRKDLISPAESIVNGEMELPPGPGLGIILDERTLAAQQRLSP